MTFCSFFPPVPWVRIRPDQLLFGLSDQSKRSEGNINVRSSKSPGYFHGGAGSASGRSAFVIVGCLLLSYLLQSHPVLPPATVPHLQRILERGTLRVATVNSPVTYYQLQDREVGFEFDLAGLFAERLGVTLEIVTVPQYQQLFQIINDDIADLAAASITVTAPRSNQVRFGPSYMEVTQEVIYRSGQRRPRQPRDLLENTISVIAGSSYAESLQRLREQLPTLNWSENKSDNIESLFEAISQRELDLTVADSNILAIHQRFYPSLKRAFSLTDAQSIAWALPLDDDPSLMLAS